MASSPSGGFWSQWWRVGGLLGIGFLALNTISAFTLLGETPVHDDPISEIRSFFTDDETQFLVGNYLIGIALVFLFFPFLLILRRLLGWVEGGTNLFSWAAFAGGLSFGLMSFVASVSFGALAMGAGGDLSVSDSSVQTLMYVDAYALAVTSYFIALMVFAASVVILRTGVLWRWLAALGAAVGVLGVVGAAWPVQGDTDGVLWIAWIINQLLLLPWILAVSINMVVKKELPDRVAG